MKSLCYEKALKPLHIVCSQNHSMGSDFFQINAGSPTGMSMRGVLRERLLLSVTARRTVGMFHCQLSTPESALQLPLPSHATVYVWADAVLSSGQREQNMFLPLGFENWPNNVSRQTAGYYPSQPEDVIIPGGKVEQTLRNNTVSEQEFKKIIFL